MFHVEHKYKKTEQHRYSVFLARLKEFESPTFRLGGGRSILLSYKRVYTIYSSSLAILPQFVKIKGDFPIEISAGACYNIFIPIIKERAL